jgi:hypothetical protein
MLSFYGHSDDCIKIEGDIIEELDGSDEWTEFEIGDATTGMVVALRYAKRGWEFLIGALGNDESIAFPFVTTVVRKHGYNSLGLEVYCPSGTPVRCGTRTWNTPPSLDLVKSIVVAHASRDIDSEDAMDRLSSMFKG